MAQAVKSAPKSASGKKARAASGSLLGEMFSLRTYKVNSGRIVRQVTAVAVAGVLLMCAIRAYQLLDAERGPDPITFAIPIGITLAGMWFAYRLVMWPRFANFLIDVETEMQKVSWASWDYLIRATIVVIAVMFIIGFALFGFDLFWQWFFKLPFIGFLDKNALGG